MLILSSCGPKVFDFYIFSDIEECQTLNSISHDDITVTVIDHPSLDKCYSENLRYNSFFAARYESEEVEFLIYAYIFNDCDSAKRYFRNATGRDSTTDTNSLAEGGLLDYKIVVIDCAKAYTVYTSSDNVEKVEQILSEIFTIKIK